MSSRIRFVSARNVFEAFPELGRVLAQSADDSTPRVYAHAALSGPRPTDAIIFLAYLLPRREAVWWAIQCVRAMLGSSADDAALSAADAWVRAPEDDSRRAALAAFDARNQRTATTWLAFAAGWSGGSVTPPDQDPMPAPPAACAQGVHTAVILAACAGDPLGVVDRLRTCAEAGIRFADGGDAKVQALEAAESRGT
jgi:hypothetical protein